MIRKLIIKYWFGIYRLKNGYTIDKAAISNFSLILPSIIFWLLYPNETIGAALVILAFLIIYFNTFLYLSRIKPVKWNELPSDLQKWYYGYYWVNVVGAKLPWPKDFKGNLNNWKKLDKKFGKK